MGIDENKAVVRQWVEATNEQSLDLLDDLFTADTYDNVGQRTGVAWWKEVFGFLYETLPDWHWTLEDIVAEGDRVVARLTVRGTHRGSAIPFLRGVEPPGAPSSGATITRSASPTARLLSTGPIATTSASYGRSQPPKGLREATGMCRSLPTAPGKGRCRSLPYDVR